MLVALNEGTCACFVTRDLLFFFYASASARRGWMALLSITSAGQLHIIRLLYDNKGTYFAAMQRSNDEACGEKSATHLST